MKYLKWLYFFWLQLCFALMLMLIDGSIFILKKIQPWVAANLDDILNKFDEVEI